MKKAKEAAAILTAAVVFILCTYLPSWLLMPARTGYGATWECYLQEERDSIDVLYLGSSIVYCNVIPAIVWEETGIASYSMAGPGQTLPITYYYLREACKTQSPQAVVLELNGMFFEEYPGHTKSNISYMPWSMNRVMATLAGAEPEELLGSFFPLYHYHDRVYTTVSSEIGRHLSPQADSFAGYTVLTEARDPTAPSDSAFRTDTDAYRKNLSYLEKIADFCAQRDIQLVLYLSPVYCQIPEDVLDTLKGDISSIPHALFFNCNEDGWPEFDPETSWYDYLHLNLYGAVPFSRRFGQELLHLGLQTLHSDSPLWQERLEAVNRLLPA